MFVTDGFQMAWLGQGWHFGNDLRAGNLDPVRLRPGHPVFLYFFQRFSPEGLTNLAIASSWLAYALWGMGPAGPSGVRWLLLPAALVVVAFSQVFLTMAYNSVELWVLNSDLGHIASMLLSNLGERPLEVYPRTLTRVLLFVAPVGALAWYPSSLLLGRLDLSMAAGYPLVMVAFAWAVA